MLFSPFTHPDISFLDELRPTDWTDIKVPFQFYLSSNFCFPITLHLEGKTIGVGCAILHDEVAWLAHIIVHSDFRNRGYGTAITKKLMALSKEKGANTIQLIATEMGAPVYEKCGFRTETEYLFYKDIPRIFIPPSNNIIPIEKKYLRALLKLDLNLSSEKRGDHLLEFLKPGFGWWKADELMGFYLPSFGEGLILASDPEAGLDLLKFHLHRQQTVVFPLENIVAFQWMLEQQIPFFRKAKRMCWGTAIHWDRSAVYNRIGGNLG